MKLKLLKLPSIRVAVYLTAGVAIEFAIILAFNRGFFIQDDSGVSGYPLLKFIGQELLSGNDPFFVPEIWTSGNIWAEAQFGLLNPVSYVFFALAALVDSVLINAVIWKFFYTVMLVWGAYRLMRSYQLDQNLSILLSLLIPISGYVLYFDLAAWGIELLGYAWLFHFWASMENYLNDRASGLQLVVPAWLLVSSGYPYAVFPLLYLAPWFMYREYRRKKRISISTLFLYFGIGFLALATYLPSLLSSSVNSRGEGGLVNTGSWSVSVGRNLFALASPTLFPDLQTNGPPNFTNAPVFYVSVVFIVLAPFVYIGAKKLRSFEFAMVVAPLLMTVVAMSLPSNFWMFRWPFRFLPVFSLCMLLLIGWVIQNGSLVFTSQRFKIGLSLVFFVFFSSVAVNPEAASYHLVGSIVLIATLILVSVVSTKGNYSILYTFVFVGSLFVLITQLWLSPVSAPLRNYNSPGTVSTEFVERHSQDPGNILQIANFDRMSKSSIESREIWDEVLLGSWPTLSGIPILNAYSASGFEDFDSSLCLLPNGSSCPEAFRKLNSTFLGYSKNLGELLGINTVLVQVSNQQESLDADLLKDWNLVTCQTYTCTFQRLIPTDTGQIAYLPAGLSVQSESYGSRNSVFNISGNGDKVLIRRLNWPGYSAKLGEAPIEVRTGPAGLVELILPARELRNEKLEITWQVPGITWIKTFTILAVLFLSTLLQLVRNSRRALNSKNL